MARTVSSRRISPRVERYYNKKYGNIEAEIRAVEKLTAGIIELEEKAQEVYALTQQSLAAGADRKAVIEYSEASPLAISIFTKVYPLVARAQRSHHHVEVDTQPDHESFAESE